MRELPAALVSSNWDNRWPFILITEECASALASHVSGQAVPGSSGLLYFCEQQIMLV